MVQVIVKIRPISILYVCTQNSKYPIVRLKKTYFSAKLAIYV